MVEYAGDTTLINLDDRVGSGDLVTYFERWRVPCKLTRLEFGDAMWKGNGAGGVTIPVAVEIKKIRDALNCMTGGRFAGHQLPGLLKNYKKVWLIIEGHYSTDFTDGLLMEHRGKKQVPLEIGSRRFMYRELSNWLTTMEVKAGMKVRRTTSRLETARFIVSLYHWWCSKTYEEHRAHLAMQDDSVDEAIMFKPNLTRRMAACLQGIGWKKSAAVAKHFSSPLEMLCASRSEWEKIEGIGSKLAERIQQSLVDGL